MVCSTGGWGASGAFSSVALVAQLNCSLSTPEKRSVCGFPSVGVGGQGPVMKNQSASGAEEDSRIGTGAMGRVAARWRVGENEKKQGQ